MGKTEILPRYPNELEISNDDMKTALSYAKSIQEFVMKIFNGADQTASEAKN